jgi:hypothetical protein
MVPINYSAIPFCPWAPTAQKIRFCCSFVNEFRNSWGAYTTISPNILDFHIDFGSPLFELGFLSHEFLDLFCFMEGAVDKARELTDRKGKIFILFVCQETFVVNKQPGVPASMPLELTPSPGL